jgi:putative SOS response-associated peptidase YedK
MCGRYSLVVTDDLGRRFRVHPPDLGLRSRFNVAPGEEMPVVYREDGPEMMALMRWGFVPSWSRGRDTGGGVINARAETVAKKPFFRAAFEHRRCLVPASGFYEWHREQSVALPYYFRLKNEDFFSFAGIWTASPPTGDQTRTYAIITTDANTLVSRVHDRMPVILAKDNEERWLDPAVESKELQELLIPYAGDLMTCWRVSERANAAGNEGEDLIRPFTSQNPWFG